MTLLHTDMWWVDGLTTLLAQYPPQHLSPMVGLIDYGHEDSVRVDVGYGITRSHATGHSNRKSDCEENDKKIGRMCTHNQQIDNKIQNGLVCNSI
jgi:hypothetical protein